MSDPIDLVRAFNDDINRQDLDRLSRRVSDAHVFIDMADNHVTGREACLRAWAGFFEAFPDYRNHFETLTERGGTVCAEGHATCSDKRLAGPALWAVKVADGLISEWRVLQDTPDNRMALGLDRRRAHGSREGVDALAAQLAGHAAGRPGYVAGLTGSVAAGKTTLAEGLVRALSQEGRAETVSTDGFLYPNAVLEERDLLMRKGFPESYDRETMAAALSALRQGHADFPGYSHDIYDIDPALTRTLARPDILILEGLGFQPPSGPARASGEPDMLIFLDAALDDIEAWFLTRFMQFWEAAEHDPSSFYARFRHMSVPEAEAFAMTVWRDINLPNLENHILPLRDHADLVLEKDGDHVVRIVEDRTGRKRA